MHLVKFGRDTKGFNEYFSNEETEELKYLELRKGKFIMFKDGGTFLWKNWEPKIYMIFPC